MGKLCTLSIGCVPGDAPAGALRFTDGAFLDETLINNTFPYLEVANPRFAAAVMGHAIF
ncbi:hypothetical protein LP420_26750 [Massilia sp. B-10]|nr:hypothetical protein LP420_26750 [Massilia sp. B-10]